MKFGSLLTHLLVIVAGFQVSQTVEAINFGVLGTPSLRGGVLATPALESAPDFGDYAAPSQGSPSEGKPQNTRQDDASAWCT